MKKTAMGLALIALVWGGGSMELADGMDPKALARDSLERLRRVAAERAAPQAYVGRCVAAIAAAHHSEHRSGGLAGSVQAAWADAAERCHALVSSACAGPELPAQGSACAAATQGARLREADSPVRRFLSLAFPGLGPDSRTRPWWRQNDAPGGQR